MIADSTHGHAVLYHQHSNAIGSTLHVASKSFAFADTLCLHSLDSTAVATMVLGALLTADSHYYHLDMQTCCPFFDVRCI
jgi:hypothetical protein